MKIFSRAHQTIALGEPGGTMGNVDRLSEAIAGLEGEGTEGGQKQKNGTYSSQMFDAPFPIADISPNHTTGGGVLFSSRYTF